MSTCACMATAHVRVSYSLCSLSYYSQCLHFTSLAFCLTPVNLLLFFLFSHFVTFSLLPLYRNSLPLSVYSILFYFHVFFYFLCFFTLFLHSHYSIPDSPSPLFHCRLLDSPLPAFYSPSTLLATPVYTNSSLPSNISHFLFISHSFCHIPSPPQPTPSFLFPTP